MKKKNIVTALPSNILQVFELICHGKTVSKTDLCTALGRNMMYVNRMIAPLQEKGLIISKGKGASTGGRKPVLYEINPDRFFVGAFNVSSTYCEVALLGLDLHVVFLKHFYMTEQDCPADVLQLIINLFREGVVASIGEMDFVLGIGLSVFGSFSLEKGTINKQVQLYANNAWIGFPVVEYLEKELGKPVVMEKASNASALLEYRFGKGRGRKRMLYVLCAMNIRSAVILNGTIMNASDNYDDAFGHMTINIDGERCECGNYGCLAVYATIPAIVKSFCSALKWGRTTTITKKPEEISFDDICDAVRKGDLLAKEVVAHAAAVFGTALANYINLIGPEVVILSGLTIEKCHFFYTEAVKVALTKTKLFRTNSSITFEENGSFEHAITIGAGSIFIEHLFDGAHEVADVPTEKRKGQEE